MRLVQLELTNIGPFRQVNVAFSSDAQVTVLLGGHNSGKTMLLRHAFYALSWFAGRHKDLRTAGIPIQDQDMRDGALRSAMRAVIAYPHALGALQDEPETTAPPVGQCQFGMIKSRPTRYATAINRPDLADLERLVTLYQVRVQREPQFSTPCIAYYPRERLVHEVSLANKAAQVASLHNAYELAPVHLTTFARFFEWYREVYDLENAQLADLARQYLNLSGIRDSAAQQQQDIDQLITAYQLVPQRNLESVNRAIRSVFPQLLAIRLVQQPRLMLMVELLEQGQPCTIPFLQLSQQTRSWIALVGDLVRRLCLLNPHSLDPLQDGEGVVMLDEIDNGMEADQRLEILSRLQQTFPRLQWIVTALHSDVVDQLPDAQCLLLQHGEVIGLDIAQHQAQWASLRHELTRDEQRLDE